MNKLILFFSAVMLISGFSVTYADTHKSAPTKKASANSHADSKKKKTATQKSKKAAPAKGQSGKYKCTYTGNYGAFIGSRTQTAVFNSKAECNKNCPPGAANSSQQGYSASSGNCSPM